MSPDDLVIIHAIEQLKYRYVRTLDDKDWDGFAAVLTEDATAHYGDRLSFTDRDGIVGFMRENLGPSMITLHQVHQPEIVVDGDEAHGLWSLQDKVIMLDHGLVLEGASVYTDRYRRVDGVWLISHTEYRRRFEYLHHLTELPGFQMTAGAPSDIG